MSTEWNNNNQNTLNGLLWRPGTSMLADTATERVPAARRAYTPPLACNYLTYKPLRQTFLLTLSPFRSTALFC